MCKHFFIAATSLALAHASLANLTVSTTVDGIANSPSISAGTMTEQGLNFVGSIQDSGWSISWDLIGDAASNPSLVSNGFTVVNTGNSSRSFDIVVAFDITNWNGPTTLFGNLFGIVDGGVHSREFMWQGNLGGNAVAGLFHSFSVVNDVFSDTVAAFQVEQGSGGSLGYRMTFNLDPDSQVNFIGAWSAGATGIPSPGALALVMCGCLCGLNRRRS